MALKVLVGVLALLLNFAAPETCHAQTDTSQLIVTGKTLLVRRSKSLQRFADRQHRQQHRLLRRLARKEEKLLYRLRRSDSALYARYQSYNRSLSFDSLSRLAGKDSSSLAARTQHLVNGSVDSLQKIRAFLDNKAGLLNASLPATPGGLDRLGQQLSLQQYLDGQISQRMQSLKGLTAGLKDKIPGLQGMEKDLYYARSRIKAFKELSDDPSAAEERALEYLQGTEGFSESFVANNNNAPGSSGAAGTLNGSMGADELEKMGFQTKRQLQQHLQSQFGNQLSGIQQQMMGQVEEFQKPLKEGKRLLKESRQSLYDLRRTGKPSFKVNPMRGFPFRQRLEKGYSVQTLRATGDRPALLDAGAQLAFRHSPRLSYGLGLVFSAGLGKDWSHIRLSFEGLGAKTFAQWQWQYGIGAYAGYERLWKQAAFSRDEKAVPFAASTHSTASWNESALMGLTKTYRVNSRWNGSIQVLWDFWWRDKSVNSPLVLRFVTTSK